VPPPVAGVGVGGFRHAYAERLRLKGKEPKTAASHTTPVTVAAETGVVGLAFFGWLVVALLVQAFRRRRETLALVSGLALLAVLCHSLFYAAFFEDPMTWGLMGLTALALPAVAPARERAPAEPREAVPV
jgi:O-antigen ligase